MRKKKKSKKKIDFFFEKIYRGKLSKLSVSYYVLIKNSSFLGHFCVTDSLTDSQTHRRTDGKLRVTELHVAAKKQKNKTKRIKTKINGQAISWACAPNLIFL